MVVGFRRKWGRGKGGGGNGRRRNKFNDVKKKREIVGEKGRKRW